jgi:hypothetical protein
VKTLCADASVDFVDVKVGHCQALNLMKMKPSPTQVGEGFFVSGGPSGVRKQIGLCFMHVQHASAETLQQSSDLLDQIRQRQGLKEKNSASSTGSPSHSFTSMRTRQEYSPILALTIQHALRRKRGHEFRAGLEAILAR